MTRSQSITVVEGHNSSYHDGGVAVLNDGSLWALSAERVDRIKHSYNSKRAYEFLMDRLKTTSATTYDYFDSRYQPFPAISHHEAHAASAYYCSGFPDATVLVLDGQGSVDAYRTASISIWEGSGSALELRESDGEVAEFHSRSLGHFYSAITYYLGFGHYDQFKTMALSSYGRAEVARRVLRQLRDDPDFCRTLFHWRFGRSWGMLEPPRFAASLKKFLGMLEDVGDDASIIGVVGSRHAHIAASAQSILEEEILGIVRRCRNSYASTNLCFAGGLALNVLANTRLVREAMYDRVFIPPFAADDGQAVGKLCLRLRQEFGIDVGQLNSAFLGPEYSASELASSLAKSRSTSFDVDRPETEDALLDLVTTSLVEGKTVAWVDGRSEAGPRALGHRSILADPRRAYVRDHVNKRVKHRECFQPFAASVMEEAVDDYFECPAASPFMLYVGYARERTKAKAPAVVHVDGTTRVHAASLTRDGRFWRLLGRFNEATGVPMLLNTSFNDAGQPIVETPDDAIVTFERMDVEMMVLGEFVLTKA